MSVAAPPRRRPKPQPKRPTQAKRPTKPKAKAKRAAPPRATGVDPRLRARRVAVRRAEGRRRLRRIGWALGVLAVLAAGAGIVVSPALDVDQVQIVGVDGDHRSQVAAALGDPRGEALLLVGTDQLRDDVRALSWVAGVTVERELPGTLRVVVRARVPVAWTPPAPGASSQAIQLVDRRGVALAVAEQPPTDLPTLVGDLGTAARVAGALPAELRARAATVRVADGLVTVALRTGPEIRLGGAGQVAEKGRVALAVLAAPGAAQARYVDVRVPSAPVTG